ncbi:hypothetical protein [Amycolatopsis magusensis]|uniref:hypothetical protein n=1 Tax=Amycolatopsis magusensis TaxID=882444 RepID=UPI003798E83B
MNGRIDATGHGRHRHRRGSGTWTPAVPPLQGHHSHRAYGTTSTLESPLERIEPGFRAARGVLPIPPAPLERLTPPPLPSQRVDSRPPALIPADTERTDELKPVRRTKVTLTPPPPPVVPDDEYDDDTRIYVAPPVDGLGTFDIGTVPASVTPPRTWRKAAWFAAASSGGVVVAMLCAGTFLVGQQPTGETRAIDGWPGENGGGSHPLVQGDLPLPGDGTGTGTSDEPTDSVVAAPDTEPPVSSDEPEAGTGEAPSSTLGGGHPSNNAPSSPGTPAETQPDSGKPKPELKKPPEKPAKREFEKQRYLTGYDAKAMADHSEQFFNTVTEDPGSAAALTEGELQKQGASGLRENYSDVAYFEVKHIYVDPNDGVTLNTVEVTHEDGSKTTEQRTLVFSENDKITDDGR